MKNPIKRIRIARRWEERQQVIKNAQKDFTLCRMERNKIPQIYICLKDVRVSSFFPQERAHSFLPLFFDLQKNHIAKQLQKFYRHA